MARLWLSLLGSFEAMLGNKALTAFSSDKVRALLAYLACEADRPHRRETLAGLLWPDWPDRSARTNLRNALSNLRTGHRRPATASPPFLLVTRETIQFNAASDHWLDVTAFRGLGRGDEHRSAARRWKRRWPSTAALSWRAFPCRTAAAFEDWALLVRERLGARSWTHCTAWPAVYEGQGDSSGAAPRRAPGGSWRPGRKAAHRHLMRLLALSGQRGAALAQYEACRRALRRRAGRRAGGRDPAVVRTHP